jgi:hypothetical protein
VTAPVTPARRRGRLGLILVALGSVALVAMWIYIYFFADTTNPNRLPDQAWAKQAETICTGYADQIDALPKAPTFAAIKPKSEALRQRAVVGQEVTDLLTHMVADLRASPSADPVTHDAAARWLADYDTYLGDRHQQLDRWAAGEDPPFAETAVNGKPISLGMDDFADANRMDACQVPQDLG